MMQKPRMTVEKSNIDLEVEICKVTFCSLVREFHTLSHEESCISFIVIRVQRTPLVLAYRVLHCNITESRESVVNVRSMLGMKNVERTRGDLLRCMLHRLYVECLGYRRWFTAVRLLTVLSIYWAGIVTIRKN